MGPPGVCGQGARLVSSAPVLDGTAVTVPTLAAALTLQGRGRELRRLSVFQRRDIAATRGQLLSRGSVQKAFWRHKRLPLGNHSLQLLLYPAQVPEEHAIGRHKQIKIRISSFNRHGMAPASPALRHGRDGRVDNGCIRVSDPPLIR